MYILRIYLNIISWNLLQKLSNFFDYIKWAKLKLSELNSQNSLSVRLNKCILNPKFSKKI